MQTKRRVSMPAALGCLLLLASVGSAAAQAQGGELRGFNKFSGLVPGVDFFASDRKAITVYEEPLGAAIGRLQGLFGADLPAGAVVVCRSVAEKDTVAEERVLKLGYKWALIQMSAEAQVEQALRRLKASMGDEIPPEMLQRFQSPEQIANMTRGMVRSVLPQVSFAVVSTLLAPEKEFRSSRLDDMSRSPLPDWLDIGIGRYSADSSANAVRWTQDRIEEIFPLEDLVEMNRPFVAPEIAGSGGGGPMVFRGGARPGGGGDGTPGGGGGRQVVMMGPGGAGAPGGGGRGAQLPKEVQDRNNFDNESALLFAFIVEKQGLEKSKALVQAQVSGRSGSELLESADYFGKRMDDIEKDWIAWVKEQKPPAMQQLRVSPGEARPDRPPR